MTRSFSISLLSALAFCCAMRLWQYYVGVRLAIYDLLLLAFIAYYFIRAARRGRIPLPMRELRPALLWLCGIVAVSTLSFFLLDFNLAPISTSQFWKRLAELTFQTVGLISVVCYLSESPASVTRRILQIYILGAAASSFYSFFEVGCAYLGHDLGKAIFGRISTYPPDFDFSAPFYFQWDIFYRAVGFAGVDAQATYTASVIPLLVLARPFRKTVVNLTLAGICIAGTAITFSRNGTLSLLLALMLYGAIRPRLFVRLLLKITIVCIPVLTAALLFSSGAREMLSTRIYSSLGEVGMGRLEIYLPVWKSIVQHPFGHGLNQFSVVIMNTDEIDLTKVSILYYNWDDLRIREAYANVHNNWLNWLFEGGWPLMLFECGYFVSLIAASWRTRSDLGIAIVCSIMLLLVSGLFNMTLSQFSSDLFFIIATTAAVKLSKKSLEEPVTKRAVE